MKKIVLVLAIALCLSQVVLTSSCPGFYAGDLLQSGKKQFMKTNQGNNPLSFDSPISYRLPASGFQFAATTSTIAGYNPTIGGFNFQVDGRRKGNSNFIQITLIIGPDQAWTSVQLSYLVSSRDDFFLWNGAYTSTGWSKKNNQVDTYDIIAQVKKPMPKGNYKVAAFISGFSTVDRRPRISVNQREFDPLTKRLSITIFCASNPLPISISISYIIYPDNHPTIQVSYGAPQGDTGSYQISGPTSFSNIIEYNQFRVQNRNLVCTGNQCQGSSCILRQKCLQLNGNVYQDQCIFCAPGIIFEYQCTRRCGANQNYINRACVCRPGFVRRGRDCVSNNQPVPCKNNQIRWNGVCRACPSGSFPDQAQTTCVCQNDFTYGGQLNNCVPRCTPPLVLIGNQCNCPAGLILYNNNCIRCPAGANPSGNTCICPTNFRYDPVNNLCFGICDTSQEWAVDRCVCIAGYHRYLNKCRACPRSSAPSADRTTCQCFSQTAIYLPQSNVCVQCGSNAFPNPDRTRCQCETGFRPEQGVCVPIKNCEFNEQLVNGNCQCKYGWRRLGPICVQICGRNQYWDGKVCICNQGHAFINNVCRPCPPQSLASPDKLRCICRDSNSVYLSSGAGSCQLCPANSYPNANGIQCLCRPGYQLQGRVCVSSCPGQSLPNSEGVCVCPAGRVLLGGSCVVPATCPARSTFNSATLTCVCNDRAQNIINGVCQRCQQNSIWARSQCVCLTGFFKIASQCRTCDPRSRYNGTDCVCNLGYYGNRDLCQPCHKSCSQCKGPGANECLSCADISLVLQKGFCSKNGPCDYGYYLDGNKCEKCIDNCIECETSLECLTCAIGFKMQKFQFDGQQGSNCVQICGDGIKYEQQCDDGNNRNGDGCNSNCEQQKDWYCSGGSSNQPSKCVKAIPDRTILSSKGAVNLGSSVVLSVRASYLPPCITKNDCFNCFKAITITPVSANVPLIATINYVPFSQYQFFAKLDFGTVFSSIFKVVIRLNRQFEGCLFDQDFNEQIQLTIDPAFLAKIDPDEELGLGQIQGPAKPTSSGAPGEKKIQIPFTAFRALGS